MKKIYSELAESMKKNTVIFIALFTILGLIALQIPFSNLLGSNVKFTLFDFFAPTAGAFLGTIPGVISVFSMQGINYLMHGSKFDLGGIIRLFPTLFAVAYFAKNGAASKAERTSRTIPIRRDWYWRRTISIGIPLLAIVIFNLNPIGRSAWQYSLFWLIPIAAHFFPTSPRLRGANLFARSLGATFTAHAVGGALWVWAFGLTKQVWLALIPQVIIERTLMAVGIAVSYVILTRALKLLAKIKLISSLPIFNRSIHE